MAMPPAMNAECDALGYAGACRRPARAGARAGRCSTSTAGRAGRVAPSTPARRAPTAATRRATPPATATSECDRLGLAGESPGTGGALVLGRADHRGRLRRAGQTCEVDTCATGAYCCSADARRLRGAGIEAPTVTAVPGREDLSVLSLRAHVAAGLSDPVTVEVPDGVTRRSSRSPASAGSSGWRSCKRRRGATRSSRAAS